MKIRNEITIVVSDTQEVTVESQDGALLVTLYDTWQHGGAPTIYFTERQPVLEFIDALTRVLEESGL